MQDFEKDATRTGEADAYQQALKRSRSLLVYATHRDLPSRHGLNG